MAAKGAREAPYMFNCWERSKPAQMVCGKPSRKQTFFIFKMETGRCMCVHSKNNRPAALEAMKRAASSKKRPGFH